MRFFTIIYTIIQSLFAKPSTVGYPFEPLPKADVVRGRVDFSCEKCTYCGLCAKRCPANAIEVDRDKKTWTINRLSCIVCANCVYACPKDCISMNNELYPASTAHVTEVFEDARVPLDTADC